jgi:hypothetical protein
VAAIWPRVRKDFFSEEKKQKTFIRLVSQARHRRAKGAKVFWFFFSKKNGFSIRGSRALAENQPGRGASVSRTRLE